MGVHSLFPVMEIVELICEMAWYFFYRRPMQLLKRKKRRDENQLSRPQLHYRTDTPSVFSKTIEPSATMDSNLDFDDSEMTDYSARSPHRWTLHIPAMNKHLILGMTIKVSLFT